MLAFTVPNVVTGLCANPAKYSWMKPSQKCEGTWPRFLAQFRRKLIEASSKHIEAHSRIE
jgi:hypothetical protein